MKADPKLIMTGFNDHPAYHSAHKPNYTGRGPKGYKLIDTRVYENVCEALFHDHQVDASEIEVHVKDGTVTLSGIVSDKETRRHVEDLVHDCLGVQHVYNKICVRPNSDPRTRMFAMGN